MYPLFFEDIRTIVSRFFNLGFCCNSCSSSQTIFENLYLEELDNELEVFLGSAICFNQVNSSSPPLLSSELKKSLEKRLEIIKGKKIRNRPKVLALEWVDPLFTSGHWVPEMINIAGGFNLVSNVGEHSRKMSLDEVINAEPDIIILMPCGFNIERTISEYKSTLAKNQLWNTLKTVRDGKIFAVDANSYFSKPSIRTVTGIEILSKIIHPEIFEEIVIPDNSYKVIE